MSQLIIPRPESNEYAPYYGKYIAAVGGNDAYAVMQEQIRETIRVLQNVPESRGTFRYAPGKWSIKEVAGHMCDTERVMAYRALRMARADATPLPGFEQDDFVKGANFDARTLSSLREEFQCIRASTLAFFGSLEEAALNRNGTASKCTFSVRALAYVIAGHERHHLKILREQYQLQ